MRERVLVVDDSPDLALLASIYLRLEGHEVECVSAGIPALVDARGWEGFGAVVSDFDLGLAHFDGADLLELVRATAPAALRVLWSASDPSDLPRRARLAAMWVVGKDDREGLVRAVGG